MDNQKLVKIILINYKLLKQYPYTCTTTTTIMLLITNDWLKKKKKTPPQKKKISIKRQCA